MLKGKRWQEIRNKMQELTEEQARADRQLETVLRREMGVVRAAREMQEIREKDHFTELFINVVGGRRQ